MNTPERAFKPVIAQQPTAEERAAIEEDVRQGRIIIKREKGSSPRVLLNERRLLHPIDLKVGWVKSDVICRPILPGALSVLRELADFKDSSVL
jgi:hypothetical protein